MSAPAVALRTRYAERRPALDQLADAMRLRDEAARREAVRRALPGAACEAADVASEAGRAAALNSAAADLIRRAVAASI
ncbi:hypothetical protein [Roseomonas elaeocarpi]|uniref:Uncharacterized protein n=1 Tax=Roseomonas elaeocarpi TaxID=907779 RepID=A0ABV6JTA4_9PROT